MTAFAGGIGTPLPPEFPAGGWVPPDKGIAKAENGAYRAIIKYVTLSNKCYDKTVKQLFVQKATKLPACLAKAIDKLDSTVLKLSDVAPPCLDVSSVRTSIDAARAADVLPAVFCEGAIDGGTGLRVPTSKSYLKGETLVAKAFAKYVAGWDKCYDAALRAVVAGVYGQATVGKLATCLGKVASKYTGQIQKVFDKGLPPPCLTPEVTDDITAVPMYALSYTDELFCAM